MQGKLIDQLLGIPIVLALGPTEVSDNYDFPGGYPLATRMRLNEHL
jgi:hypothetical protein